MTFFHEKVCGEKIEGVCAITFKFCPFIQKSHCLQKIIKNIYIFYSICQKFIPRCHLSDSEQCFDLPLLF